jgi:hypothetical protein
MDGLPMSIQVSDKDFEMLSRWVDGELNDMDSRRLAQRIKAEPALQQTLEQLQALNHSLRHTLSTRAPVPASITRRVRDALEDSQVHADTQADGTNIVRFPTGGDRAPKRDMPRWPLAIAASLVAAVGAIFLAQQPALVQTGLPGNDALVSTSLDELPSGEGWTQLSDGREVQPVLTFAHRDGTWCREYLLRSDSSDWRAVACQEGSRWVTQAAGLESYLDSASNYRPAGAPQSPLVSVFISENAVDIALGRDEEATLIQRSWK